MRIAIGLLALALTGAEAPTPPTPTVIAYELRFVEMSGVAWRGEMHARLQPVARQGGITVWTVSKEAVAPLMKAVMASPKGSIVQCPKVSAVAGSVAHISQKAARNLVVDAERGADGPVNHATKVSYEPKLEKIREGTAATIRGRKLDQGVLAQIALDDTRLAAVHNVALSEVLEGKTGGEAGSKAVVQIQVPEVEHHEVAGEWLIPNDGALVVSFGVATVAETDGKAGVRERLALLTAKVIEGPEPAAKSSTAWVPATTPAQGVSRTVFAAPGGVVPLVQFAPVFPASGIPMPAPRVPSRTLPHPVDQNGAPAPLPPLPEDHAPPTALPHSSEPCATPQTRAHHPMISEPVPEGPSPTILEEDYGVTKASVVEPDDCEEMAASSVVHAAPAPPVVPSQGAQTLRWKAFNGAITIELKAMRRDRSPGSTPPSQCEVTPADAAPVHPR